MILVAGEGVNTSNQVRLQILHGHEVKNTPNILTQPYWTMWGWELIDMPPRGCSLITYWSTGPDMQSICQQVSLARWGKCPLNTFDHAVLRKYYRVQDHIEPACLVFHTEPCQNPSSLAVNIFPVLKASCYTFINYQNSEMASSILFVCF